MTHRADGGIDLMHIALPCVEGLVKFLRDELGERVATTGVVDSAFVPFIPVM